MSYCDLRHKMQYSTLNNTELSTWQKICGNASKTDHIKYFVTIYLRRNIEKQVGTN